MLAVDEFPRRLKVCAEACDKQTEHCIGCIKSDALLMSIGTHINLHNGRFPV